MEEDVYGLFRRPVRVRGEASLDPYTRRIACIEIKSIEPLDPLVLGAAAFMASHSFEDLARLQGVKPLEDVGVLAGGFPENEDIDAFLEEFISTGRRPNSALIWTRFCWTRMFSYLLRAGDRRGDPYRGHVRGKTIAVSFITVGELYYGATKARWSAKTIASLEQHLKAAVIVPYDVEMCKTYARLRAALKTETGSDRVLQNDLWVAASAVRHNLPLITNNRKHFEGIPGLNLISEAPRKQQPQPQSLFEPPSPAGPEPGPK